MGTSAEKPGGFNLKLVSEVTHDHEGERWLIEQLWANQGCGLIGGTPKTGKTWASLELAISVASGHPAFSEFEVRGGAGPVLYYPAEDKLSAIRERVELLCAAKGVALEGLPLYLLDSDKVHLDDGVDRERLRAALEETQPRLVVFDPLVRLHRGSESNAQHVAELLGYLRAVQRRHGVAIIVTHHLAKQRSKGAQPGVGLRGSGDLHAWGDSNLYLNKLDWGGIEMLVEQRHAESPEDPLYYKLERDGGGVSLKLGGKPPEVVEKAAVGTSSGNALSRIELTPKKPPLREQVVKLLRGHGGPLSQVSIRKALSVRNQRLTAVLRELSAEGAVVRGSGGWLLAGEAINGPDGV